MNRLELQALANLLEQPWYQPVATAMAGAGELDVVLVATTTNYRMDVAEAVLFVRDSPLVHV